jgi:hypothetical protein
MFDLTSLFFGLKEFNASGETAGVHLTSWTERYLN